MKSHLFDKVFVKVSNVTLVSYNSQAWYYASLIKTIISHIIIDKGQEAFLGHSAPGCNFSCRILPYVCGGLGFAGGSGDKESLVMRET